MTGDAQLSVPIFSLKRLHTGWKLWMGWAGPTVGGHTPGGPQGNEAQGAWGRGSIPEVTAEGWMSGAEGVSWELRHQRATCFPGGVSGEEPACQRRYI